MPTTSSASHLPPDDREFLAFLDFFRRLTVNERVAIVKAYRPQWTVSQLAAAVGVCERTILRSVSYRRLRTIDQSRPSTQSKWRGRTRRHVGPDHGHGFSNPDDPEG